jgi:hypothetical protein
MSTCAFQACTCVSLVRRTHLGSAVRRQCNKHDPCTQPPQICPTMRSREQPRVAFDGLGLAGAMHRHLVLIYHKVSPPPARATRRRHRDRPLGLLGAAGATLAISIGIVLVRTARRGAECLWIRIRARSALSPDAPVAEFEALLTHSSPHMQRAALHTLAHNAAGFCDPDLKAGADAAAAAVEIECAHPDVVNVAHVVGKVLRFDGSRTLHADVLPGAHIVRLAKHVVLSTVATQDSALTTALRQQLTSSCVHGQYAAAVAVHALALNSWETREWLIDTGVPLPA